MLTLPRTLSLTPAQFAEVCAANPEAVLELDALGHLIEMTPTGGATGVRNTCLLSQLQVWARSCGTWKVFDSSTSFLLPDGSVRSPDASMARLERWQALMDAEQEGFPPLCPELVVELARSGGDGLTTQTAHGVV
jgi:Uma2 family endonuclease